MRIEGLTENLVQLTNDECKWWDEEWQRGSIVYTVNKYGEVTIEAPYPMCSVDIADLDEVARVYRSYFNNI